MRKWGSFFYIFIFTRYLNSSCILERQIGRERGKDGEVRERGVHTCI